jgi:hypothetical protein
MPRVVSYFMGAYDQGAVAAQASRRKTADPPVEQATTLELSVNLETVRALGITLAPSLLLRADGGVE